MPETGGKEAGQLSATPIRPHQLTSVDAQFLAMEDGRNVAHVVWMAIFNPSTAPGGELTLEVLRRHVKERLFLIPPFRWKLQEVPFGIDLPYWIEDPDFDLDFHVRELALPTPGSDSQLAAQAERIVSRPLDRSHPLWEMSLIQGLGGGRVALLTKLHHSMVDGTSSLEIFGTLFDSSPEGDELPAEPDPGDPDKEGKTPRELFARGLLNVPERMLSSFEDLPGNLAKLVDFPPLKQIPGFEPLGRMAERANLAGNRDREGHVLQPPDCKAPSSRFNGRISAQRRISFGSLSLDTVKKFKAAYGATVNDVVVAVSAAGLRKFLIDRGELPDEPLVAMIPMSTRTSEQAGTFGNRVFGMFVPIPTTEPDPVKRLRFSQNELAKGKEYYGALPTELVADLMNFIPPALYGRGNQVNADQAAAPDYEPLFNVTISNVPGSRDPQYLAGALLEAQFPLSVVSDGMLLNITLLSYRDHLDFGIVGDREIAPDFGPVIEAMQRDLEELERRAEEQPG